MDTETTTPTKELCGSCGREFDTLAEVFSHDCDDLASAKRTLSRPPSPLAQGPRATDKQVAFLVRLGVEYDDAAAMSKGTASETIDRLLQSQGAPKISDKQEAFVRSLLEQKRPDADADAIIKALNDSKAPSRAASELIDDLKSSPDAVAPGEPEIGEGFWVILDSDTVVKVQMAVHGSGRLYAKQLDTETGRFEYWAGGYRTLRQAVQDDNAERLTLEKAKQLGHLYGRCCCCGATLTSEDSIEQGIGPVCAKKVA